MQIPHCRASWHVSRVFRTALLLLLFAALLPAGLARAQLEDDARVSTEGTQFVAPAPRPQPPPAPPAPQPAAPSPQQPAAEPPAQPAAPAPEPPRYPSVVVLLDTSDSMLNRVAGNGRTRLDEAKGALEQVLRGMSPETRVQVWTFNTRMTPVLLPGMKEGQFVPIGSGANRKQLISRVREIRTAGGTNLYQSVAKALEFFADPRDRALYRSGQRYPVLVVVSDGEDSGKTPETLETVLEARKVHPLVTVTAIGFRLEQDGPWFETLCTIATRPDGCATANDEAQLGEMLNSFYRPLAAHAAQGN